MNDPSREKFSQHKRGLKAPVDVYYTILLLARTSHVFTNTVNATHPGFTDTLLGLFTCKKEDPRRRTNFSSGLHSEILVRVINKYKRNSRWGRQ